jgi:ABC-type branched-subunit amino acid transport system substrate-binding protein
MLQKIVFLTIIITIMGMTLGPLPVMAQDEGADIECEYDLTGETYRFYHFGDLSGPFAFITQPVLAGFDDAIAYFNENGGLCGAEIAAEWRDTGAEGERAQAAWDEFSQRDDAHVIFLYLTDDSELLREQANESHIPIVVSTASYISLYGDNADEPAYVFGATPLYHDQLGAFCDYISEHWDEFGIEGDPVIGHVSWLNAFGRASDTDESRAYCESVGVGYAHALYYFPGIPDISTQVTGVLDEGANIIYTTSLASGPAQLAGTIDGMDLRDQVLLAGPNWVLDTSVIALGGDSVAGFIGQMPIVWWDETDHPGIQLVTQYWAQHRLATAEDPAQAFQLRNIAYLIAWGVVDLYRQFMTQAINEVGPENLDSEAVYDALTSGTLFAPVDGIMELQFSDTLRNTHRTRIGTIQFTETDSGRIPQIIALTDWFQAPDLIPGGADVPE